MKVNVILNYQFELEDAEFDDITGDFIGEMIGQESANEIISSLRESEEEATIQLFNDNDEIIDEKKVSIF